MRKRASIPLVLHVAAFLFFLYLPMAFLPLFSFNDSAFIAFPLTGFTTAWYEEMALDEAMRASLFASLKVGIFASVASTLLGLMTARALTRHAPRGGSAVASLIGLPLFIPDIVLGIAFLIFFTMVEIPLSLVTVAAAHTLVCLPFAVAVLTARLEGFDGSLEEASHDLGENALGTFFRVTLPLVAPGLVASLLLTFVVSFDEFLIAYFLSGETPTLPVYIWAQLRFPYKLPSILALGSAILILSCLLIVLAELIRRRGSDGQTTLPIGA